MEIILKRFRHQHAHTIERFIYTFKTNLYRRLDALNQNTNEWAKHVSGIITKYNNTVNSTIDIKPVDAVKKDNHLCVSWHLWNSTRRDIKYEEIKKEIWSE